MILIGESINVMSKTIGPAMKNKEPKPIQEMALAQQKAGMDYLDINIGPARKNGPEMMAWMVKTVQEVVDLPLFLDTTNVEAIEAGLKVHRGEPVINSISCRPERMDALFPLAKQYDVPFVALLWGVEGMPRDAAERGANTAEMLARIMEEGISEEKAWFDAIVVPVSSQQDQVRGFTEFMEMFGEMAPGCNTTCGLSNVSNGAPEELRPLLNQTYLAMLLKHGLSSAIVNAFEIELVAIGKGERPEIVDLIHRVMDGEDVDMGSLSPEEADYVKTTRVLMGESLYSDSWLKL